MGERPYAAWSQWGGTVEFWYVHRGMFGDSKVAEWTVSHRYPFDKSITITGRESLPLTWVVICCG